MNRLHVVTGANGHLGRTVIAQLLAAGQRVRALVLPGDKASTLEDANVEIVRGDVCDIDSLTPLFANSEHFELVVIHAAAIIDISSKVSKKAYDVNVQGTKNVVSKALEHNVYRFIHVSSVHAIPEAPNKRQICETKHFSPDLVIGGYAKTKAEASQFIMDCVKSEGLPALILHPSGIIGPGDSNTNNTVAAVRSYYQGKLSACPRGGYDLVDVRDVAAAVIAAIDKGRVGETYILSGTHYEFSDIFAMVREITGKRIRCTKIPMWMAKMAAPFAEWVALMKKQKPLITRYSMQTLTANDNFTHEKASRELNFWPRDFYQTLQDTIAGLEKPKKKSRRRVRMRTRIKT